MQSFFLTLQKHHVHYLVPIIEARMKVLKKRILPVREMTDSHGEVIELPATTRTLDTFDFGQYIEKCAAWLAEFAGIVVIPSEMFFEEKKPKRTLTQDLGESIIMARNAKRKTA